MDSEAAGVEGSQGNGGYSAESLYHHRRKTKLYIYLYIHTHIYTITNETLVEI